MRKQLPNNIAQFCIFFQSRKLLKKLRWLGHCVYCCWFWHAATTQMPQVSQSCKSPSPPSHMAWSLVPRALLHRAAVPGEPEAEEELQDLGCPCKAAQVPLETAAGLGFPLAPGPAEKLLLVVAAAVSLPRALVPSAARRAGPPPSSVPAACPCVGSSARWGWCSSAGVLCCNVFSAGELWFRIFPFFVSCCGSCYFSKHSYLKIITNALHKQHPTFLKGIVANRS